jgi:xanthine dehydrogenase YagS FAD-binding subunit
MRGAPATGESFARAADAELAQARPLRDNAYKCPLASTLIVRTLLGLKEAA